MKTPSLPLIKEGIEKTALYLSEVEIKNQQELHELLYKADRGNEWLLGDEINISVCRSNLNLIHEIKSIFENYGFIDKLN